MQKLESAKMGMHPQKSDNKKLVKNVKQFKKVKPMSTNNEKKQESKDQEMKSNQQNPSSAENNAEKEVLKVDKTINLDLTTVDSNIFYIMGAFGRQARREMWTQEEIDFVLEEAKKHDYNHAIATISDYCEPKDEQEEEE